jgi:murein DD-endopeptidase MepM/ murein hydrolase activator NlpD
MYTARVGINTYMRPGGSKYGSIYVNDSVYVCGDASGYKGVIYNISGGKYKFGWIREADIYTMLGLTDITQSFSGKSTFDPIWPLEKSYTVTTLYFYSSGEPHSCRYKYGIDMSAPEGENVLATEAGTVISSEYSTTSGFGNWIRIKHKNGKVSLYAHLKERYVKTGQEVRKGQVIGAVGHTSNKYSMGNHLHFELGNNETPGASGDPWQEYFKPKYGNKVMLTQAAKKYPNPTK